MSNKRFEIPHTLMTAIIYEYNVAKEKHPAWPTDIIHASAIVAEESGELTRAALQHTYENGSLMDAEKEAIQTAVTCIRFIENLYRYK